MILRYYFLKRLTFFTAVSTLVLTSVIWLAQSLRFMDMIVTRGISLFQFFHFILFLLPDLVILSLPIGFFISVIFTYHRFIVDHELVVMRSSGCSDAFLLTPVVLLGSFLTLLLFGLTVYILPLSFQKFREIEIHLRHHYSSSMILPGEFTSLGSVTVYTAQKNSAGVLKGLFIHDRRIPKQPVTITAEEGISLSTGDEIQFILKKGTRQETTPPQPPSLLLFDAYTLQLKLPQDVEKRQLKPYEMPLSQLLWPPESSTKDQRQKFKSEAHQRLLSPFYTLSFGVLAAFFLLQVQGQRRSYALPILYIVFLCAFIQGGSLALLQQKTASSFLIPMAYGLVFSPLAGPCFQLYRQKRFGSFEPKKAFP